ncbi:flagellar FlbD family protein [Lentisphaerota bacterium WC36G]|nr:flagellar FlbD family protein [Lentisphaerae bacterium WC36]
MIKLTELKGKEKFINSELIESIEQIPDTLVSLTNGSSFLVREKPEEIVKLVINFKKEIVAQQTIIIHSYDDQIAAEDLVKKHIK